MKVCLSFNRHKNKNISTITKISDELWDMISTILPYEKPNNTVGRPEFHLEKYWMVFYMFLEPDVSGRCFQKNLVLVLHAIADFSSGLRLDIFKNIWIKLLEEYDSKIGIKWMWQSLDSISIKSP